MIDLILASASPRRADLLNAAGYRFRVVVADIDEEALVDPNPWRTAEATALAKARAVAHLHPEATVIGGDTVVALPLRDGYDLLAKPKDEDDARRMLRLLGGREHLVVTGVAVVRADGERVASETSRVTLRALGSELIDRYVASGEPMDKAGAYAIQGDFDLVARLDGPYDNVVGLPIELLRTLL